MRLCFWLISFGRLWHKQHITVQREDFLLYWSSDVDTSECRTSTKASAVFLTCEQFRLGWNQTCSAALVSSLHPKPRLPSPPVGNKHVVFLNSLFVWTLFLFFKVMDTTQACQKFIAPFNYHQCNVDRKIWFTFSGRYSMFFSIRFYVTI